MNQNQSWNLSLEGAWNSTTVNGITENRTFNEVYEILASNSNPLARDRKGNLTQNKDSSQYTWDYNNQLSHAINASSESSSYTYDALGRRISKQINGTLIVYVNVGYQIAVEYQSTDGINFTEKQSYVYATYIDDPLALIKASGERFYYHSNGQFSISKITDAYKNVVETYAYNAYGDVQILQSYAGLDNPYYFTGRQLDQETGLFYFRARYYDAKLGQFISRDPIGYIDGMSLYRGYFAVNVLDPFGLLNRKGGGVWPANYTAEDWVKLRNAIEEGVRSEYENLTNEEVREVADAIADETGIIEANSLNKLNEKRKKAKNDADKKKHEKEMKELVGKIVDRIKKAKKEEYKKAQDIIKKIELSMNNMDFGHENTALASYCPTSWSLMEELLLGYGTPYSNNNLFHGIGVEANIIAQGYIEDENYENEPENIEGGSNCE